MALLKEDSGFDGDSIAEPSLGDIRKRGIQKGDHDGPTDMFDYVDDKVAEVGHEACWCIMCPLTGGCAWARCSDPLIVGRSKILCMKSYSGTTDCCSKEEGCVASVGKMCCIVSNYSFPPQCCGTEAQKHDGIPTCAICNARCGGEDEDAEEGPYTDLMEDTFLCYQCFGIFGCGVAKTSWCGGDYPMCAGFSKLCCLHSGCSTTDCCGENGCCYIQSKTCCILSANACPPGGGDHDGIPSCALCGKICCGDEEWEEEPGQQEMM